MKSYIVHPEAEFEATEAVSWYRKRSPQASQRFAIEVQAIVNRICAHPRLFPSVGQTFRRAMVRRFPYSIYYRDAKKYIEVFAVAHAKRKPYYWASRTF